MCSSRNIWLLRKKAQTICSCFPCEFRGGREGSLNLKVLSSWYWDGLVMPSSSFKGLSREDWCICCFPLVQIWWTCSKNTLKQVLMIFLLAGKGEIIVLSNSEEKNIFIQSHSALHFHYTPFGKIKNLNPGWSLTSLTPVLWWAKFYQFTLLLHPQGFPLMLGIVTGDGWLSLLLCKQNLASLGIFKERYQSLTGGLMGDQDSLNFGNRGRKEECYTKRANGKT